MSQNPVTLSRLDRAVLPGWKSIRRRRAATAGSSWLSDSLGLMLRFKAAITLPCVTLLRGRITVYGGKLGFGEWPVDVSCSPVLKKCFSLRGIARVSVPFLPAYDL
jgi:hypothetical protein